MPLVINRDDLFRPGFLYRSGHVQTIVPTLYRKVSDPRYIRERIETRDGDFIDIDYASGSNSSAVILCHGLEGASDRAYMRGMARAFLDSSVDAYCFNFRSCSGELNRKARIYSAGGTDDLELVVEHVLAKKKYSRIFLAGFSLGGNLILKFLGERGEKAAGIISGAVAVSAAVDLKSTSLEIIKAKNFIYHKRFVKMLLKKYHEKVKVFPELHDIDLHSIRTMFDFDNNVAAPLLGFRDAFDYWEKSSSRQFLDEIRVPTLILSSMDDPILGPECYPFSEAEKSEFLFLETTEFGGHVGFLSSIGDRIYWHEKRTVKFITENCF